MKRLLVFLAAVGIAVFPWPAVALTLEEESELPDTLLFSEVKVKNDADGYNEFIELYNNSGEDLDLSLYSLNYFNNPEPTSVALPTKTLQLPGVTLLSDDFLVLARDSLQITGSVALTSITSLADAGGLLRLIGPGEETDTTQTYDELVWKDSSPPSGGYVTPSNVESLQRAVDENSELVATAPQWLTAEPTPFEHTLPLVIEHPEEGNPGTTEEVVSPALTEPEKETPEPESSALQPIQITELLPNPIAPQTDALDEFVELFNPSDEPIDLDGYTIQTGTKFTYRFVIKDATIEPHNYLVFTSGETNLALSNTSGDARLLDSTGSVVASITSYSDAPEGQAWALINGSWKWTTTPTAGATNNLTAPAPKVAKAATKTAKAKKKTKTAAKTTKKTTTPVARATYQDPGSTDQSTPVHPSVLVGVSALALLYGAYEYRHDMANRFYQLRRYRETRRTDRAKA